MQEAASEGRRTHGAVSEETTTKQLLPQSVEESLNETVAQLATIL